MLADRSLGVDRLGCLPNCVLRSAHCDNMANLKGRFCEMRDRRDWCIGEGFSWILGMGELDYMGLRAPMPRRGCRVGLGTVYL